MVWKLADAKNKLSEVVNRALSDGPQIVVRRQDSVVVLAHEDYQKLTGKSKSFKQFLMMKGPGLEGLDLKRDQSPMREADL